VAPTCFGSSLPSSWSFLDPSELLEIPIEWVVYHIMCGYVTSVLDCRDFVSCASQLSAYAHIIWYTSHSICISSNSEGSKKLPDDGRLLPKHVGARTWNKGVVQIRAHCWSFQIGLKLFVQVSF
jgi:hypothetical protein